MKDKKVLYDIMVKYDNDESFRDLCDSLSNIIQNKFDKNDIMTIIRFSDIIESDEVQTIDNKVGFLEFVF
jgi:hypothetical protein